MLPTRKKHPKKSNKLPKDFLRTVEKLFQKQFAKSLAGAHFSAYGDLYHDEVVSCFSLVHQKSLQAASLHLSMDLPKDVQESPEKVTDFLKEMVDVAASWFAQCFEEGNGLEGVLEQMRDMDPNWQEIEWEGKPVFVKLNKTNYALERAADDLLKKAGFDPEDDEDAELDALLNEDDDDGPQELQ